MINVVRLKNWELLESARKVDVGKNVYPDKTLMIAFLVIISTLIYLSGMCVF